MALGKKTGGRVAGSQNKTTLEAKKLLSTALKTCKNPFLILADMANDSELKPEIRLKAAIELCSYTLAKPKEPLDIELHQQAPVIKTLDDFYRDYGNE